MYRLHPQTAKLGELIASGVDRRGPHDPVELRLPDAEASCRSTGSSPTISPAAASSMSAAIRSRWRASSPARPRASPSSIRSRCPAPRISAQAGTDEWSAAVLTFENGIVAQVSCAVFVQLDNVLRIHGADGPHRGAGLLVRRRHPRSGPRQDRCHPARWQARDDQRERDAPTSIPSRSTRRARRSAPGGRSFRSPGMSWADSLGNARVLDQWRAGAGLEYDIEKPARRTHTLSGRTLEGRQTRSRSARFRACRRSSRSWRWALKISAPSRRARSCSTPSSKPAAMLFDTAFVYGAGYTEKLFGDWHTSRGVREESVHHRQGRAHAALLSRCHREAADAVARSAEDRLCRRLFHAPRQPRYSGRRVRRCDGRRGEEGPHPRHFRRLELDARAHRRGESPMRSGPASRALARSPTTSRWPRCRTSSGPAASRPPTTTGRTGSKRRQIAELRLVEPGPRLLHRPRRPRQARQRGAGPRLVLGEEFRAPRPGDRAGRRSSARARSTWRSPTCWRSRFRSCR